MHSTLQCEHILIRLTMIYQDAKLELLVLVALGSTAIKKAVCSLCDKPSNDIVKHLVMECHYLLTERNNMFYTIAYVHELLLLTIQYTKPNNIDDIGFFFSMLNIFVLSSLTICRSTGGWCTITFLLLWCDVQYTLCDFFTYILYLHFVHFITIIIIYHRFAQYLFLHFYNFL